MSISKKRAKNLKSLTDKNIDYLEIPELGKEFFENALLEMPEKKKAISLRVDTDVLKWFKSQGESYQTRMNAILRAFMRSQKAS